MKSVVKNVKSAKSQYEFPCLVKYPSDGVIILATGYTENETGVTGTCINTGSNNSLILGDMRNGEYHQSWTIHGTVLCNDAIELSN